MTECFRPDCNDIIDARYGRTLTSSSKTQLPRYRKMGVRFRSGKTHRVDQENWILLTHDSCKNPEISDFLKNHALIKSDPLNHAFFSDRTGNIPLDTKLRAQRKYAMWTYALCIRMY